MKFSYNWIKKYVDVKLPPEKLAELLTLHSFETNILRRGKDFLLDCDILPNRAHDSLSHYGLAKEISVLTKKPLKALNLSFRATKNIKTADFLSVEIKDKNLCPRYRARVLDNVKIAASPKWLTEKLSEFNIKPHNNIVDILNYVMLEIGQPMHAFDYEKISNKKIIVKRAKSGEKIDTLDGSKYDLNENILIIADGKKPIAIAGIKGGFLTGISAKTKTIILESANFGPTIIRRARQTLDLNTDAAIRFSAGLDPNLTELGLNRACALIAEIVKDVKIAGADVDIYPKKFMARTIRLNLQYLNNLVGANFRPQFVKNVLESLGAKIKAIHKNSFLVTAPTARLDLEQEEDLIEEIARIYGYMNLESELPLGVLAVSKPEETNVLANKVKDILVSVGWSEVYNYSFIGKKNANENDTKSLIEIKNPISAEFKYLRPNLIYNLLKNVKNNFRFFGKMKFFEVGKVFFLKGRFGFEKEDGRLKPEERLTLSGILAVKEKKESLPGSIFFEVKSDLDVLLGGLGIVGYFYDSQNSKGDDHYLWHGGRTAAIKFGDEILGIVGEINPAILEILDIAGRAAVFNLDFLKIEKIAEEEKEFAPISKYPTVIRDIAFLVNKEIRVSEVLNVIYGAGADLVEDVDLFDYYEGGDLAVGRQDWPEGKKNLAFHIVYSSDHTLTDEEVRREEEKIKNSLIEKLDVEIR